MAKINNQQFQQLMEEAPHGTSFHVCEGKYFGGPVSQHKEEKAYYFECGCGSSHSVSDAFAVREQQSTSRLIFSCPGNDRILTMVSHKVGMLGGSKGIETLVSCYSEDGEEVYSQINAFRTMREKGLSTLREQFDGERRGEF